MTATRRRSLGILAFCALYIGTQLFFIVRGHFVEDKRLGFWMFAESTQYRAAMIRITRDGKQQRTQNGAWTVNGKDGKPVRYAWNQFVNDFGLENLERQKRAKTGFHVTCKYLEHGLNFVLDRVPEDRETVQLVLHIQFQRAGGPVETMTLESRVRELD